MPEISLSKARSIVRGTLKKARELELKPLVIVMLDTGGHLKAFERGDDAATDRFQIAQGKAYGVIMTGMTGTVLFERAQQHPFFVGALNGAYDGKVVPVPGGILVRDRRDRVIGAAGVSGDTSENHVNAALAGIESAGLSSTA